MLQKILQLCSHCYEHVEQHLADGIGNSCSIFFSKLVNCSHGGGGELELAIEDAPVALIEQIRRILSPSVKTGLPSFECKRETESQHASPD